MKRIFLITGLFCLVGSAASAEFDKSLSDQKVSFVPASKACSSVDKIKYCVYEAKNGVTEDIVYHLHGRNLDENIWNEDTYYTAMLQQYWQSRNIKPPKIVSVSFGAVWLLAKRGKAPNSGLLEVFLSNLSTIESRIGNPRSRILLGESMGGLNVLLAGLSGDVRFAKIASLCPGVYVDSPFSPPEVLQKAAERTGADPQIISGLLQMLKQHVADEQEWLNFSPLETIEKLAERPSIYLSCGLYDKYGNYEGTEILASKAAKLGFKTEWHPLYGGHCAIDIVSLGNFLAR